MQEHASKPITAILDAASRGDEAARERLWSVVYDELHAIARRQLVGERAECTLQTTALVNEAYLRLVGDNDQGWSNRRHFFAAAARAMRCIRIDQARRRRAEKRGGGRRPVDLDVGQIVVDGLDASELLALDEALDRLEQIDAEKAEIVMLRYFAGLTIVETAEVLGRSPRKVNSQWRFARAWLHRELSTGDSRFA